MEKKDTITENLKEDQEVTSPTSLEAMKDTLTQNQDSKLKIKFKVH